MKEIISSQNAPPAAGPYSQAVKAGDLIFISGQLPLTPEGVLVEGGIKEQTIQILKNLKSILEEAEITLEQVVKTTIYLDNMADFDAFNEVYREYFPDEPPARACVEVSALPQGVSVEIAAVAVRIGQSPMPEFPV
ncbi:MAG: RidA family protein [Candidatus Euphemobacter frigidus]|nr:RidA family protein [Candidatus Euphemobacter frigidus]MDP8275281.1 RidA family protein [Candidatus Euphemobacter frigidus]